jgi:NAD(P)-dependent dehydrogenase (short-subunit alcohol dehydrogenase family)
MRCVLIGTGTAIANTVLRALLADGHAVAQFGLPFAAKHQPLGGDYNFIEVDLRNLDEIDSGFRSIAPPLDFVVYLAGCGLRTPILLGAREECQKIFDINVFAVGAVLRNAAEIARKQSSPVNVVILSSINGKIHVPEYWAYCASRCAVESLAQVAAVELAPFVRTVVLAAGPMSDGASSILAIDHFRERLARRHLVDQRLTTAEDVCNWVTLMLERRASWVTGQTIFIDGGVHLNSGELPW